MRWVALPMTSPEPLQLLSPDWPSPASVHALVSTRRGGNSGGPFASANFGDHVTDDPAAVAANRLLLVRQTGVTHWPWVQQVHGVDLLNFAQACPQQVYADAVYSSRAGFACAVLTADCLPLLLCDASGTQVAAVHAGWRGLAAGVINNTIAAFAAKPQDLLVYLGPAIGPRHFEVGMDVYGAFGALFARMGTDDQWRTHFAPADRVGHYFADIYGLAREVLRHLGVRHIFGGNFCTYADSERFYSYRRDGVTGRMVSAIWLQE